MKTSSKKTKSAPRRSQPEEMNWMRRSTDIRYRAWDNLRGPLYRLFDGIEARTRAAEAVKGPLDEEIANAYAAGFEAGRNRTRAEEADNNSPST